MVVYIVTREENGRTAVWPPFARSEKAVSMIEAHIAFRVRNGATLHRTVAYTPAPIAPGSKVRVGGSEKVPVLIDAPEVVECCIHESEIINEEGGRTIFRVSQHMVRE